MIRFVLFLAINFAALGLGGLFTGKGVPSDWYQELNKAPWTPPGWVFGAAWTTIMICFSIYLSQLWPEEQIKKNLIILFSVQWVLNVAWNPAFFYAHYTVLALVIIIALTLLVGYFIYRDYSTMGLKILWVTPYFVWLLIATSLNAYVVFKN